MISSPQLLSLPWVGVGVRKDQLPLSFLLPLPVVSLPCLLPCIIFSTQISPSQCPPIPKGQWHSLDPRLRSRHLAQCPTPCTGSLISLRASVFCKLKEFSVHTHSWFKSIWIKILPQHRYVLPLHQRILPLLRKVCFILFYFLKYC